MELERFKELNQEKISISSKNVTFNRFNRFKKLRPVQFFKTLKKLQ